MSLQGLFLGAVVAITALSTTGCQAEPPPPAPLRLVYLSGIAGEIDPCG